MKNISTKKLIIGFGIIAFLALVGLVRVIAVVGGNISKSIKEKSTVETNGDITSLNSTEIKDIVDNAEKELKTKNNSNKNSTSKTESQMTSDKQSEINKLQSKLPVSNIISNTDFNYQNTLGVVNINDNYYVGYYCGLKEVWEAANKATYYVSAMESYQKNEETDTAAYKEAFYEIKKLTPYIKSIQDMNIETASPIAISVSLKNYMVDTAKMNLRNIDRTFYLTISTLLCNTNTEYYSIATNPKGVYDRDITVTEGMEYLSTISTDKYPALNAVLK